MVNEEGDRSICIVCMASYVHVHFVKSHEIVLMLYRQMFEPEEKLQRCSSLVGEEAKGDGRGLGSTSIVSMVLYVHILIELSCGMVLTIYLIPWYG